MLDPHEAVSMSTPFYHKREGERERERERERSREQMNKKIHQ
jgi:hypothetical protein